MELHKIENVNFSINQGSDSEHDINLVWKEGKLYLSLKNIMLTDGKRWYDIPIMELENIQVISENPIKLRFQLPSLDVIVTGNFAERLSALRHLLLPFIHPRREEIMKDSLSILLKFWSLGVRNPTALCTLLPLTAEEVRSLISLAKEENLIANDGKLTKQAYDHFSDEESKLLRNLEAMNE